MTIACIALAAVLGWLLIGAALGIVAGRALDMMGSPDDR